MTNNTDTFIEDHIKYIEENRKKKQKDFILL